MGIINSFLQYGIIMILLAALAVGGILVGKSLRHRKDQKEQNKTEE